MSCFTDKLIILVFANGFSKVLKLSKNENKPLHCIARAVYLYYKSNSAFLQIKTFKMTTITINSIKLGIEDITVKDAGYGHKEVTAFFKDSVWGGTIAFSAVTDNMVELDRINTQFADDEQLDVYRTAMFNMIRGWVSDEILHYFNDVDQTTVAVHVAKDDEIVEKYIHLRNCKPEFQRAYNNGYVVGCYLNEYGVVCAELLGGDIMEKVEK